MEIKITKGKIPSAVKIVLFGPEGIGKSTFASKFPNPLYIDTEGSTKQLDVARLPNPTTWSELLEEVKYVIANPNICGTLVIDTADWAEKLAIAHTVQMLKVANLADVPWGKGYEWLEQEFKNLLNLLDDVIYKGINVVLTAHAQIRTFYEPDNIGQYDRYELKLQKKTSPLLKEWAEMLLFANYKTQIIIDQKTGKSKGMGGNRVMYTTHTPSWDAKNRFDLAPELPFEYSAIAHIFGEQDLPFDVDEVAALDTQIPSSDGVHVDTPHGEKGIRFTPLVAFQNQLKIKGIKEDEVMAWCKENNIQANSIEEIEEGLLDHLNHNFDKFIEKIVAIREKKVED